jgi:hypothetical protein
MEKECSCSTLFIDAEQKCAHRKAEVDRKKTLKSISTKCFKLTGQYFIEEVININKTVTMFLEIHTCH